MHYPKPYIDYLVYFHGLRDYFECHEVLEEYWKEDCEGGKKDYWVSFIQIAVSLYHQRRNNFKGAYRMMKSAAVILQRERNAVESLGINYDLLLKDLENRLVDLQNETPYQSMNLPLTDEKLIAECKRHCEEQNCVWGNPSDLTNDFLLNKHTKRDRSGVIAERDSQRKLRAQKRKGH
ncbi:DUF309 domain-containing protein [Bacillus taeanensis]|uniref:DUF309 domain-containing protein n=1 Tax=Bacillus taeanensis TaxID=273032 RepID=A0A366XXI4_9BACI|nr:DUF309 domain-containing protein [Bacillus taeanensis]RBW70356.1 DUF309 domain-containing protein [Bacillus taeanensis]